MIRATVSALSVCLASIFLACFPSPEVAAQGTKAPAKGATDPPAAAAAPQPDPLETQKTQFTTAQSGYDAAVAGVSKATADKAAKVTAQQAANDKFIKATADSAASTKKAEDLTRTVNEILDEARKHAGHKLGDLIAKKANDLNALAFEAVKEKILADQKLGDAKTAKDQADKDAADAETAVKIATTAKDQAAATLNNAALSYLSAMQLAQALTQADAKNQQATQAAHTQLLNDTIAELKKQKDASETQRESYLKELMRYLAAPHPNGVSAPPTSGAAASSTIIVVPGSSPMVQPTFPYYVPAPYGQPMLMPAPAAQPPMILQQNQPSPVPAIPALPHTSANPDHRTIRTSQVTPSGGFTIVAMPEPTASKKPPRNPKTPVSANFNWIEPVLATIPARSAAPLEVLRSDSLPRKKKPVDAGLFPYAYTFPIPAHFPTARFINGCQVEDSVGIVLRESMTLRFDDFGQYQLTFDVETPAAPIVMRLQLILVFDDGRRFTLTPPAFRFPYEPTTDIIQTGHDWHVTSEGISPVLRDEPNLFKNGKFGVIRVEREGTARIGAGLPEVPAGAG